MKHIRLFENYKNKLDIPYDFIEEVKDLLVEYEDKNMNIILCIQPYIRSILMIYHYEYYNGKLNNDMYYNDNMNKTLKLYKENNISLNKFVYHININRNKELSIKFVDRLKQIYPNINTDILKIDVMWSGSGKFLNSDNTHGIHFILE